MQKIFPGEAIMAAGGAGTYNDRGVFRAAVVGTPEYQEGVAVIQNKGQIVPRISNTVMCRVFKVTFNIVQVHILAVEGRTLRSPFLGIIRLQDIRKHEIEKVIIEECFQPGDIVLARVISLGDSKWFYLSTAETELGVVLAWNREKRLLPYNWEEMIDCDTQETYKRKVAKPLILG